MKTLQKTKNPSLRSLITEEIIGVIELLERDIYKCINLTLIQSETIKLLVDKMIIDVCNESKPIYKQEVRAGLN